MVHRDYINTEIYACIQTNKKGRIGSDMFNDQVENPTNPPYQVFFLKMYSFGSLERF